jgi:IS5 family transposase
MKNDGLLRRNHLKGELGDALHAILCGAGHNICLILRTLRIFLPEFWRTLRRAGNQAVKFQVILA